MKFVLLAHLRRDTSYVLAASAEYTTAADVTGKLGTRLLKRNAETFNAISAGVVGHHFVEDADFTYQIVVKA